MGKGQGGSPNTTTVTNSGPPTWEVPYYLNLLQSGQKLANQPDPFPNYQVAGFTPYENQGINMQAATGMGLQGSTTPAAEQNLNATLSGQYLNPSTNPYLQSTENAAAQQVTNQYQFATAPSEMSAAALNGSFGGSGDATQRLENQFGLGTNLSNLAANMYGQNYSNERGNQMQALGQLGNIESGILGPSQAVTQAGGLQQAQNQQQLNAGYQNAYNQANYPYQNLSFLSQLLASASGGGGSSSSTGPNPNYQSPLQDVLGLGLGGAGIYSLLSSAGLFSDERIKTDIETIDHALEKIDKLRGVTYEYSHPGLPRGRQAGLIAQDLQKVLPEAVVNGDILAVKYEQVIGLLVEGIKELRAEVAELKRERGK